MTELYALVDYENVQPTLAELEKLAPGFTKVWLFHGPHQAKPATQLEAADNRVNPVPRSGRGPNALDFHLSFYLGYEAARHPNAQLVVVANDRGYDPMIAHARLLGFAATRVGFMATRPAATKPRPAKKAAAAKTPAPAKKAASKKVPAKKTPAKKTSPAKAAVKQTPARQKPAATAAAGAAAPKAAATRKAPTKQAPAKKAPAKTAAKTRAKNQAKPQTKPQTKTQSKAPTLRKQAAQPRAAAAPEAKEFSRIKQGLAKMGSRRPLKLKSFLRHLESMLGQASTPAALDALVKKLAQEGVVHIAGDKVSYG